MRRALMQQMRTGARGVVQRTVRVRDANIALGGVNAAVDRAAVHAIAPNLETWRTILSAWVSSPLQHDFSRYKSLAKALTRAAAMRGEDGGEVPALFRAAHHIFTSRSGDRPPTLYFRSGDTTGRLRSQHPTGPLAKIDASTSHRLFFASDVDRQNAREYVRRHGRPRLTPINLAAFNTVWVPTIGHLILEIWFDGDAVLSTHPSEGRVVDHHASDEDISLIYRRIVGRA